MSPTFKRIMLKISGEVLQGDQDSGISFNRTKELCEEIIQVKEKTGIEIVIVVGGGNIWRYRDFKDSNIPRVTSDYMGMTATIMNATALKSTFENLGTAANTASAFPVPHIAEQYHRPKTLTELQEGKIIICAGGTGNPFFTTDSAAALRALELDCEVLLKATKVDGVFDKDPVTNPDAKHFPEITFDEVLEKNLQVMDLAAVSLCREKELPIIVFNLNKKGNILKAVTGEKIGSKITS